MKMVDQKYFGEIAEEIVLQMLKKQGKKVIDHRKNPKEFADFQVGKTRIEVKGHNEDHTGGKFDKFDYVARYITLSVREWDFLNENPNQFEIYIVYRLNETQYKDHPDWNYPKYVKIKGSELIGKPTNQPTIQVKTIKPFWSDKGKRQHRVSKSIFEKAKKKYKK